MDEKRIGGRVVHTDCRYFLGDRPCLFHKKEGTLCEDCKQYDAVTIRILIVKLGAMGDVLRTTCILPTLASVYERPHITWLTAPESVDLLRHNPYIDCLLGVETISLARLQVESFDLILNPEASKESAALAGIAQGITRKGFGLDPGGRIIVFNPGAEELFTMGLFDDIKQRNRKTYAELVCQVMDLPFDRTPPILNLTGKEKSFADRFRKKYGLAGIRRIVGINTGGGGRWQFKRWTKEGFVELAQNLSRDPDIQVLLLGGAAEEPLNQYILSQPGVAALDGGSFNSTRQFAALIDMCDVVVTGDSMALHMGLAAGTRMVVLFGPTSHAEIDLYGLGKKIIPPIDCLCCYRQTCDKSPNCMDLISVESVSRAVREQLEILG